MKVEFDIKCTVNIDIDNKDYGYYNQFKNNINKMSDEQLKEELLDDYIKCCELTARCEVNRDGFFDNIQVNSINIVK